MSEFLQPGQHLDADLVSALVDHALPPHEREAVLAHLAKCGECRETVALVSPPIEAVPTELAKEKRPRWFFNLSLLAPIAAAGLAAILLYVHFAANPHGGSAEPEPQIAREAPAPPIQPPVAPMNETNEPRAPTKASSSSARESGLEKKQSVAPTERNAPALDVGSGAIAEQAAAGSKLLTGDQLAAPTAIPQAKTAPAQQAMNRPAGVQNDVGAASSSGGLAATPPRVPQEIAAQTGISQDSGAHTDVLSSKDIDTLALEGRDTTELLKVLPGAVTASHLPGGAAPISTATRGQQVLAIDARHHLYLSNDAGATWSSIRVPWKSRAVKAEVISYSDKSRKQTFTKARGEALDGAPIVGGSQMPVGSLAAAPAAPVPPPVAAQKLPAAPTGSLVGTVTDATGGVIPHAKVVVTNSATHAARLTLTDGSGRYRFEDLAPGTYEVAARVSGFEPAKSAVQLASSQANVVNFKLQVGAESLAVTVEASPQNHRIKTISPPSNETIAGGPVNSLTGLPTPAQAAALFQITTKNGQQWTSADGLTWQRK